MLLNELKEKNILIWGLGVEGQSVKNCLEKKEISCNIYVYNDSDGLSKLKELMQICDIVVRSPGVSIYRDDFQMLKDNGLKITSSTDLFLSEIKTNHPNTKVIGITGSKGKTTSSSALYHMLQSLGCKVALGGNIGKPLIELLDEEFDYIIGEFSSYQCSDLNSSPDIAMFTNIFSVHTDWHGGHIQYCKDKINLAVQSSVAVVNANNTELVEYTQNLSNKTFYGTTDGFYAIDKNLYYRNEIICNIDNLQINGNHQMENLAGVMTIIKYLGLDWRKAIAAMPKFGQIAHRLQDIGSVNGIRFINDSISTAPQAAIGGMQSFDDKMAIISGGTINKQDYTEYAKFIEANPKVKIAVTLFQCGPQIADSIRQWVKRDDFKLYEVSTMQEAVSTAYHEIQKQKGSLVLFSPTAPSFGYYKNFIERGEDFINCVNKLK